MVMLAVANSMPQELMWYGWDYQKLDCVGQLAQIVLRSWKYI